MKSLTQDSKYSQENRTHSEFLNLNRLQLRMTSKKKHPLTSSAVPCVWGRCQGDECHAVSSWQILMQEGNHFHLTQSLFSCIYTYDELFKANLLRSQPASCRKPPLRVNSWWSSFPSKGPPSSTLFHLIAMVKANFSHFLWVSRCHWFYYLD